FSPDTLFNLSGTSVQFERTHCSDQVGIYTNQTFIGLVCDQSQSSEEFLYYYMTFFSEILNNQASGTTILYLSRNQFEELMVFFPPLPEQTVIATVLSDMDAEITALEKRLDKTIQIKQGMMQELLTGRIRLV
ncbi:MAG: restriction endonuclease subunit S, partial [Methanospirillaceae archaeon]|nr:restriction endonuclease subunit S [Methanospirillaceae archaeon]